MFTPLARTWVVKGLWATDKQKARELATQTKGERPHKVVLVVNSALANRWPYKPIAEILQPDLKGLGFEVELRNPDFFFGRWIHSNGQMNVQRGVGYNNPEADRLVELAAAEREPTKRKELYAELQRLVASDVPLCPIYHDVCLYATRKEVRDLTLDPFFKPSLEKAWIK